MGSAGGGGGGEWGRTRHSGLLIWENVLDAEATKDSHC